MNALMYHDIVTAGNEDASGFPGRDAALYKVTADEFVRQLDAIHTSIASASPLGPPDLPVPVISFDDGGKSGMVAAEMLEQRGWMGYFFITTNYIGTRGFLSEDEIRILARRGHAIGSHSCSHPLRMGHCSWPRLLEEWSRSCSILSEIIGAGVTDASVPGGDFAPQVAEAAATAGITRLFTSEPTRERRHAFGLTLTGRFAIQRWTSADTVAGLAAGDWLPCARQAAVWSAKKVTKRLGGERYLQLRRMLLGQGNEVRWGDTKGGGHWG